MTDILLSHGYFLAADEHEQKIMKPYPPLGLLYVSAHLKAQGFVVDVFDSTFETPAAFADYLRQTRPPLVGLYVNLMTRRAALQMIGLCRQVGVRVVLGGPEPPYHAAEYLARGADVVVVGEGELTLSELIPHLARCGMNDVHTVRGIIFADESGQVVRTPPRPQIANLSAQPWPDRESIPLEKYLSTWQTHHGVRSLSLITARGCPYSCTWCSHTVFGQTHRRRTPQDVAAEVAHLAERYRPDQLWYADDVFTIQPRWTVQYAAELRQRGLKIPFECISRADRLTPQLADVLAEMGCSRLWIGAESGSQRILDAMRRKTRAEDVQAKTRLLQSRGIAVGMFIMLGYEGEQLSDIEATAEYLKRANPDVFLTTVSYPIKGTPYHAALGDRVAAPADWAAATDRDLRVLGRHSRQFYSHATRWLVSEVNLHKLRASGSKNWARQAKLFLNAQRGRWGMWRTRRQRETGDSAGGGRGWLPGERAADAW